MKQCIIVVDDDRDDLDLTADALEHLKSDYELLLCETAQQLIDAINQQSEMPLMILCDLNMPGRNGFDIREQMLQVEHLRHKSVPFLYWSTEASDEQIGRAYAGLAQGVFIKPSSMAGLTHLLSLMVHYWQTSQQPKKEFNNK